MTRMYARVTAFILILMGTSTCALAQTPPAPPFANGTGSMGAARSNAAAVVLADGRVLVVGGSNVNGVLNSAEFYDPSTGNFTTVGTMTASREYATATLLANGTVLVAGGYDGTNYLSSAEIFDPNSNTFSATSGAMTSARIYHTATLLQNGTVLIAGGFDGSTSLSTAEIYDPSTGSFTSTGSMASLRQTHTATPLADGRVLMAGGYNGSVYLSSTEIYDPAAQTFSSGPAMSSPRIYQTASLLHDGRVLLAGGFDGASYLSTADVYTPAAGAAGTIAPAAGAMSGAREHHAATTLGDGRVLITGGTSDGSTILNTSDVFDPSTNKFAAAGTLVQARENHLSVLLANGDALVIGGLDATGAQLATAELFSPFVLSGNMTEQRSGFPSGLLLNGKVLVAGGFGNGGYAITADLFDPATGTFSPTSNLNYQRWQATSTVLDSGKVLIAAGANSNITVDIYDPVAGTFSVGSLNVGRYAHAAAILPDGRVLIAGGLGTSATLDSSEIYDPVSQLFTVAAQMNSPRSYFTMTPLPDGRVLVAGGDIDLSGTPTSSAEIYDPQSNSFTPTASMAIPRSAHTATLLNDGRVLITGGRTTGYVAVDTAEIYDPVLQTFSTVTSHMSSARYNQTATLLNNGAVLISGGLGPAYLSEADVFDPVTNTFFADGTMAVARASQSSILLLDGRVLEAGGSNSSGNIQGSELYSPASLTPTNLVSILVTGPSNIGIGAGQQFVATGTFSDSHTETLQSVTWSSSDTTIATISNDATNHGRTYGIGSGSVTITACTGPICGSTSATAVNSADMAVGITSSPVAIGTASSQTVTYNVSVTNRGSASASNVQMIDTLPAGMTFVSATPTGSGSCSGTATITCNWASFTASETETVAIVATANAPSGNQIDTATVSATTFDPNATNNTATATTYVSACLNAPPSGYNAIWVGGKNGDWFTAENWSTGALPTNADSVFICGQAAHAPIISSAALASNILIGSGTSLDVAGSLTTLGNVDASAGPINGAGTLNMTGDGSFTAVGTLPQTIISTNVALTGPTSFTGLNLFGNLDIAGQSASVAGDMSSFSGSSLIMQNASGNLTVSGNTYFNGGNNGTYLNAGTLNLAGNFSVGCCDVQAFAPSGTFVTNLIGTATQNLTMSSANAGGNGNHFHYLNIAKTGGAVSIGTVFVDADLALTSPIQVGNFGSSILYVQGNLSTVTGSTLYLSDLYAYGNVSIAGGVAANNIYFEGANQLIQGSFGAQYTYFYGPALLAGDSSFGGTVYVQTGGTLDMNSHAAIVGSDFYTYGPLLMTHASDKLTILGSGNFFGYGSDSTTCGANPVPCPTTVLTAGTLELGGTLSAYNPDVFVAGGSHLTRLIGRAEQPLDFVSTGTGNQFQDLEIANTSAVGAGIYLERDVVKVAGKLIKKAGPVAYVNGNGNGFDAAGVDVNGLILDYAKMIIGAGPIVGFDNVSFTNLSSIGDQLTINNPGASSPYNFSGLKFLSVPTPPNHYVVATDTANDGNTLTVNLVGAYANNGPANTITNGPGATTTIATASVYLGAVSGIGITSGGSGYTATPSVTLVGGDGSGATAVAVLTGDAVTAINVTSGGSGYTIAPVVVVSPPPGTAVVNWTNVPLLHWYTFFGNANDQVGTANGTLVGGATAANGMLTLDGSTGYVQFSTPVVPSSGSYSVTMFATEAAASSTVAELISQGQTGGGFYIGHDATGQVRLGDSWTTTGIPFPGDGLRHHYALSVDGTTNVAQFYIDGVLAGTHAAIYSNAGDNTKLGAQYFNAGEYFDGTLQDVRVYGAALSAAEIGAINAGQDEGADLSLQEQSNSPSPTAVAPGGVVYYSFYVNNNSSTYAPNVKVQVTVPADATVSSGVCTTTAPTLTCTLGDAPANGRVYGNFNLTLNTTGTNAISMTASSDVPDPDNSNNTLTTNIAVSATTSDLSISMTAPSAAAPGATVPFNLTVNNNLAVDEPNAVVTLQLPAGFSFSPTGSDASCSGANVVVCNVGTITASSAVTLVVNAMASSTSGIYLAAASVSSQNPDSDTYNNVASAQVFVTQYGFGVLEFESLDNSDQQQQSYVEFPTISADGRLVAFDGYGQFTANANSNYNVFLRDNCRGATGCTPSTTLISANIDGTPGNNDSYTPTLNRTGRYIGFVSYATNLGPNADYCADGCSTEQIYVRDLCPAGSSNCTGMQLVSQAMDGTAGNDYSGDYGPPALSATGRYIAFDSFASNLIPEGTDGEDQVLLRDTCLGASSCSPSTVIISKGFDGAPGNNYSFHASISADGRYVAFESSASNLVPGSNSDAHIYLRDTCVGAPAGCTPSTVLVDVNSNGAPSNSYSYGPSISATGRYIVFQSESTDIVPAAFQGSDSAYEQVYVRDTCIGAPAGCMPMTVLASISPEGQAGNYNSQTSDDYDYGYSSPQVITDNGRYITFLTEATNLAPGFSPTYMVQVVRDTCLGATGPCTPNTVPLETTIDGNAPNSSINYWGAISADGSYVAFDSYASNLLAGDTNGEDDVFLAATGFAPSGTGADLSVSVFGPGAAVVQGGNFGYSITVTNNGTQDATNVTLTNVLPPQVTFSAITASQGTCSGTTTITCALGALANGTSATVGINVNATTVGTAIDTASISATEPDPNTSNNSASVSTPIVPPVSVTISPASATVNINATEQFTATVTNSTNTSVTWTASAGTIDATGLFTAPSTPGSITVTATSVADPTRSASATVTVAGIADLVVTNSFSTASGTPTYSVTVSNSGPSAASSVTLSVSFDRFTYLSYSNPAGACNFNASVLVCNLGALSVNGSKTVNIAVAAPSGGWASLSSLARAFEHDPNPTNNSARMSPTDSFYNTSAGDNITVNAADTAETATVGFASVSAPGTTSLSTLPLNTPPPAGYRPGNPAVYYDVATTATYSGAIQLNFGLAASQFHHPSKVRLFHLENGAWVDRTVSINTAAGLVGGVTRSLSPFALFEPVDAVPVANGGADRVVAGALTTGASITLDGSASTDADGDALTYRWSGPFAEGANLNGMRPNVTLPFGTSKLTLVVNDGEQDSPPVTINVTVSDFGVAAVNPSATVTGGSAATYSISLSPKFGAFDAPVTLSCAKLPAGMNCSFGSATLTPGAAGASTTLTLTTSPLAVAGSRPIRRPNGWGFLALMLAPFGFISIGTAGSKRRRWILGVVIAGLMALVACGGGSMVSPSSSTQPAHSSVTSTIVVNATSGGVAHSTSVSVTVQ